MKVAIFTLKKYILQAYLIMLLFILIINAGILKIMDCNEIIPTTVI